MLRISFIIEPKVNACLFRMTKKISLEMTQLYHEANPRTKVEHLEACLFTSIDSILLFENGVKRDWIVSTLSFN